jgi:hypothetical protein
LRNRHHGPDDERVAMQMTGHKTGSVFRRYDIVSPDDLRVAVERLNGYSPAANVQ